MATDITVALQSLNEQIDRLSTAYRLLQEKLQTREAELRNLESDLQLKEKEIFRLEQENRYLRVSYRLADSPDTLVDARKKIAGLMRGIEKCIAQLKE